MGAGGRYNTNSQKGNPQPSPNHGGGQMEDFMVRLKRRSHLEFLPNKKVEYIGSHKDFSGKGTVMSNNPDIRKPRTFIR